ncbi:hypothetical protein [Lumpfish ranavirus]|nr:hypothetical protein QKE36_gp56 [Lumpfish ranavirus]AZY88455.1 hypothetical protein [Lumpfish ranavirus]
MRPSVSVGVYIRNVWTDGRYLPWLYQRDHVTDVVAYSQSDPEKYISFLQSIASAIEPKIGDVEELMFLPHMSYAKMAMSDIGGMAECLRSESVKDFKDHNKSVVELLGLMFGERPFGHLEMLSEQRAAYSCGEAGESTQGRCGGGGQKRPIRRLREDGRGRTCSGQDFYQG